MHELQRISPVFMAAILLLLLTQRAQASENTLRVAYEWKEIDFKYENAEERWSAIERFEFKPENVIPFGIEIYKSRLFVTLPRWREGVPASLAYLELNDTSSKSPALLPYPSWEAHSLDELDPELVSPFRVRADRCDRLWVLDSRIDGIVEDTQLFGPAQLLIYDLHNDELLRRHIFPKKNVKENSFFGNLAVEDTDCDNTYAYAGDLGNPGLVVYSWNQDESWRVKHHFFHPDPLAGNFSIDGYEFQWDDGLYGMALKPNLENAYSTLYFHPLTSTMEFQVDTKILRNKTLATSAENYHDFKILGSRGANGQSGASVFDPKTGVLFYTLPNLNAVACWKSSESNAAYNLKTQGKVYTSPVEMLFPSDVKIDAKNNLWVLTNRLQEYLYGELFPNSVNFRILMAPVEDAIKNTPCEGGVEGEEGIVLIETTTARASEKSSTETSLTTKTSNNHHVPNKPANSSAMSIKSFAGVLLVLGGAMILSVFQR